jgi:hypothetical protein
MKNKSAAEIILQIFKNLYHALKLYLKYPLFANSIFFTNYLKKKASITRYFSTIAFSELIVKEKSIDGRKNGGDAVTDLSSLQRAGRAPCLASIGGIHRGRRRGHVNR